MFLVVYLHLCEMNTNHHQYILHNLDSDANVQNMIIELNYLENPSVNKVIIDEKGNKTCAVSINLVHK